MHSVLMLVLLPQLWIVLVLGAPQFGPSIEHHQRFMDVGAQQLNIIRNNSLQPRYGNCWTRALARLDATCSSLTDRTQAELALRFGKCFMDMASGVHKTNDGIVATTKESDAGDPDLWCVVGDHGCMRRLPDRHFAAFQQFFATTESICYLVQSQRWNEQTRDQIEALRDESQRVHRRMDSAGRAQKAMLAQQLEQMELQREAKTEGRALRESLVEGRQQVKEMAEEWRRAADEQRIVIGEMFGRLVDLHGWLVAEGAWTGRWAWWLACGAGMWMVVAATGDRVLAVRWVFIVMCGFAAWLDGTMWPWMVELVGELRAFEWTWMFRKAFVGALLVVWMTMVVSFVDKRNERLDRMERRQIAILDMLQQTQRKEMCKCKATT